MFVKVVFHFLVFEMFPYSLQLQRKHIGTDVEVERLVASFFILHRCKFCTDLKMLFHFVNRDFTIRRRDGREYH